MEPHEVQTLGEAMSGMHTVSQADIGRTLEEFVQKLSEESSLGIDSAGYFRNTITKALGKDRATSVLSRLPSLAAETGLTTLKWMDPRVVAKIIRNEHPQIIATVISQLEREQAGEVLNLLGDDLKTDVIIRITRLDKLQPAAIAELNDVISDLFENNSSIEISGIGGVRTAAEILNEVTKETEELVLQKIEELDNDLYLDIKEGMFVFENLLSLDDRGMQTLLRDLSNDKLIIALKGASNEMQHKIFKNMSKRAAELLRDDLEAQGPVKLSEVEEAQKEIIGVAQNLAEDGKIALGGKGEEFV